MAWLVCIAIAAGGCKSTAETARELPFRAMSIERHPDGSIAKGLLASPATIAGVPCQGWIRMQADGRLSSFELASSATVQGHELPAASYVWLDDDARLQTCFLSRDTSIQGYVCRGGPFKIATSFHANGKLRAFFPREVVTIDGIPCASSTQAPVTLHDDGRLAGCRLAADATINGKLLRRGDQLELDGEGHLSEVVR